MDGEPLQDGPVLPHVWNALIPPDSLSITSLLTRYPLRTSETLPIISFHRSPPTCLTSFDNLAFNAVLAAIRDSPLPAASALRRIRERLPSAPSNGYQSLLITFGAEEGLFPLWFEKCLTQLETVERSARRWRASTRWLESSEPRLDPGAMLLRAQCAARLDVLGWNKPLRSFPSALLTGTDLATFLSNDWLTDDHINAAGDWINAQLGDQSRTRVLSTHFLGLLSLNHQRHATWHPNRPYRIDELVTSGDVNFLLIPVHLPNHWTYLHVNIANRSCVYADSLDPDEIFVPDGVLGLLDWWLATVKPLPFETGLSEEERDFEVEGQTDSYSCGVFVISTMAHVALHDEPWLQGRAKSHQQKWFIRLSEECAFIGSKVGILQIPRRL